jgi:dihydropteroate synthase
MGVLNVTPDSFSDGGRHLDPARAIAAGLAMAEAGAALVDVGGETTRPRAAPTPPEEERRRILPVIRALAAHGVAVSVDTRNAATMAAALDAGARVVNDVSALAHDPDAARVVAGAGCPVVLMHMRGTPATMHEHASYADVAQEVARELALSIEAAEAAGIARAAIAIDPGIGFAKMAADNLALLPRLPLLLGLGRPLVVGVSRKRFIGTLAGEPAPARRLPGSLAAALHAAGHGAAMLRVHDVAETVQALRVWRALASPSLCDPGRPGPHPPR